MATADIYLVIIIIIFFGPTVQRTKGLKSKTKNKQAFGVARGPVLQPDEEKFRRSKYTWRR